MAPRVTKQLVIDASIMRAAGDSEDAVSASCRNFLEKVRTTCHRAVMTEAIRAEWRKHQSVFSAVWLGRMNRVAKVVRLTVAEDSDLRDALYEGEPLESRRKAMLKDCHLIEAAIAADRIVSSLDDNARRLFGGHVPRIKHLERICWVNPSREEEGCIAWLAGGAKPDKHRCLRPG